MFDGTAEQPGDAHMVDDRVAAADEKSRTDPNSVQSLADFARACDRLRAGRSYAALARAARPRSLPPATLSGLLNARTTPTLDTVTTFLIACGLGDEAARGPWLAAWRRVATAHQPRHADAVRVRQARPRLLGVHAAIRIPGASSELPPYVPRDLDLGLRAALAAAATQGGFVLLLGGSSVGKTRALYEAVNAGLPDWWLLHPGDAAVIAAHAVAPTPRTVLWIDELQRYLDHPDGLSAATVRRLITSGTVLVATLWPDDYNMRIARPPAEQEDRYANDRALLGLASLIEVPEAFTSAERRRGETLASTDERIRIALDSSDAGFTQVLAAGPSLVRRWELAPAAECYGKAVITAALDARRVGADQPATRDFLSAAAPAYLTPAQQALAPSDWLDRALTYATSPVHGAAACLTPVAAGMGSIAGFTTADYLHQHAQRARRATALPDLFWQTLVACCHPDDDLRVARSAQRRGRPEHAVALYRRAAESTDPENARAELADVLIEQGRVDEALRVLRDLDGTWSWYAARKQSDVLIEQGRVDEALRVLRDIADAGHEDAKERLADVLAAQGRLDELRDRAAAHDEDANRKLADVLAQRGCLEELRERAATGRDASFRLANVLVELGRVDELRERADIGDRAAVVRLPAVLVRQGRIEEALQWLLDREATGDEHAARQLVDILCEDGRADELRRRAATGDDYAADRLATALVRQGDFDEALVVLRERNEAECPGAADQLARLLAKRGHVDEALGVLRDRDDGVDEYAALRLAEMLAEHNRVDELRNRAATRSARQRHFAHALAGVLAELGHIDELRERAVGGDKYAAERLVAALVELGRVDEIHDEVAAGTPHAVEHLHRLEQRTLSTDSRPAIATPRGGGCRR
ncbi:tetratricopeptide repeat protein [Actinoplanes sp. NPDC000266]